MKNLKRNLWHCIFWIFSFFFYTIKILNAAHFSSVVATSKFARDLFQQLFHLLHTSTFPSLCHLPVCVCVCAHSLLLDYWRNEFLMHLMGRVQTLWDSGVRSLITPLSLRSPCRLLLLLSPSHPLLSPPPAPLHLPTSPPHPTPAGWPLQAVSLIQAAVTTTSLRLLVNEQGCSETTSPLSIFSAVFFFRFFLTTTPPSLPPPARTLAPIVSRLHADGVAV